MQYASVKRGGNMTQEKCIDFDQVIDRRHDAYSYSSKWSTSREIAEHCGLREITDDHIALQSPFAR